MCLIFFNLQFSVVSLADPQLLFHLSGVRDRREHPSCAGFLEFRHPPRLLTWCNEDAVIVPDKLNLPYMSL